MDCCLGTQQFCICEKCGRRYLHEYWRGHTRRFCNSCRTNKTIDRHELKRRLVDYCGGSCILCGYGRCLQALDFHHFDPDKKRFRVAGSHTRGWQRLLSEIKTCALLCSNCHIELEATSRSGRSGPRLQPPLEVSSEQLTMCGVCGRRYVYDRKKGHTRKRCNSCGASRQTPEKRHALKKEMIGWAGGSCRMCGYRRSPHSLTFHHVDPATKRFNLAGSHSRSLEALRAEVAKCVLLCANCHDEVEAGHSTVPVELVDAILRAHAHLERVKRRRPGRPRASDVSAR